MGVDFLVCFFSGVVFLEYKPEYTSRFIAQNREAGLWLGEKH